MDLLYTPKHGFVSDSHPRTNTGFFYFLFSAFLGGFIIFELFNINFSEFLNVTWSLFVAVGVLILIFSFLNLETAVLSLVFIVPITSFQLPGLPFVLTLGDAYLLVVTVAWLMRLMVKSGERIEKTPFDKPLILFVFLSITSLINAHNMGAAATELVQTLEFFIASVYLFHSVIRTTEDFENAMLALALSGILFSMYGIREYMILGSGTRVSATFGHFNAFGAYLAMLVPLFFNMSLSEHRRGRRVVFIAAMALAVAAVMFTFSRGAWIGILSGLLLASWLRGMNQFIKYLTVGVIVIITISVFIPKQIERYTGRMASITEINDESTQSRLEQYEMSLEIMMNSPFFGTGIGQVWDYASARGTPELGEIHNLFLNIGADRGIPAMIALFFVFLLYYRAITQRITQSRSRFFKNMYIANISVLVSFLVVNLTAYQLVRGLGVLLGLFLGLGSSIMRIESHLLDSGLLEEDLEYEDEVSREPALLAGARDRV